MHLREEELNCLIKINQYSIADLSFIEIASKIIESDSFSEIAYKYYNENESSSHFKRIEEILVPNESNESRLDEIIKSDTEKLLMFYLLGGMILDPNIKPFSISTHCKKLVPQELNINELMKFFNNSFEEFTLLIHNRNEKHYRKNDPNDYDAILREIVPIQMKMKNVLSKDLQYISGNRAVYKVSDYVYLDITSFNADFPIKEKYIVIHKTESSQYKYKVPTGMQYTNNVTAMLPSNMILRWNKTYILINVFGAPF